MCLVLGVGCLVFRKTPRLSRSAKAVPGRTRRGLAKHHSRNTPYRTRNTAKRLRLRFGGLGLGLLLVLLAVAGLLVLVVELLHATGRVQQLHFTREERVA